VKIAELKEALESVTAEQKYLKAREARHRHSKPNELCKSLPDILVISYVLTINNNVCSVTLET
jgi:hypothetical protein